MGCRSAVIQNILAPRALRSIGLVALAGCAGPTGPDDTEASFALTAVYDSIRSYPGGGGIFLVRLDPEDAFAGEVVLSLAAPDRLRAEVARDTLSDGHPTAELIVRPEATISSGHFKVTLTGTQGEQRVKLPLDVEIVDWLVEGLSEHATLEKNRFVSWLADQDPALAALGSQQWWGFQTYPEMLVVEHWTFLSPEWEMRICVHVMIPPHDWSMVRLRRRGESEPVLTARRETDGTIHPIPAGEYPTFGY